MKAWLHLIPLLPNSLVTCFYSWLNQYHECLQMFMPCSSSCPLSSHNMSSRQSLTDPAACLPTAITAKEPFLATNKATKENSSRNMMRQVHCYRIILGTYLKKLKSKRDLWCIISQKGSTNNENKPIMTKSIVKAEGKKYLDESKTSISHTQYI